MIPQPIESAHNTHFKRWRSLLDSRGIKKQGQFLLSGRKTVPEALARHPGRFHAVLCESETQLEAFLCLPAGLAAYRLPRQLFRELDVIGTGAPLLVGSLPSLPRADLATPPQGVELACALGNPDNLGAVLRSAAAFGVRRVILLEGAAHPFHPRALRAGANAQFELELQQGPSWTGLVGAAGPLIGLDAQGEPLAGFDWPDELRLVLGEEGQGLPPDLELRRLAIPMTGAVESLNATIAASVALFSCFSARAAGTA
ncbi:RNA methyltransferase [Geminicoccaceae bacterium 1502E]|nr:RNA methyltransferase [Geminicoccaceae bacterium 1502E]